MAELANILLDESGRIRSWNSHARGLWGFDVEAIRGRHFSTLYAGKLPDVLSQASETGQAEFRGSCVRRDGSAFTAQTLVTAIEAGTPPQGYSLVVRSLAGWSDEPWHGSEALDGIIQSAMDAIITIDAAQRIVVFNETATRMFRCRAEEAIGSHLERFIPERFRAVHRDHVERFGETRVTARAMGGRLDLFGLRADGEEFPIDASISQVTVDGEKFYTVILRDVSERRRAEEALERSYSELRELSRVMNEVREAERTRVARELHDELAQWLTALKMDIAWLSARLPAGDRGVLDRTERMKKVVDTTVASVRRIAADLRPVMLDDLGLIPSIEHLLQAVAERANLAVTLDVPADGFDFRDPLATSVYRMVQEALTNVARHAGATEVRVALAREGDALLVRVADNGVGLRPPAGGRKSYGLLGIRERAQTLGGEACIYSPAEGGTMVEIRIPLARFTGAEAAA